MKRLLLLLPLMLLAEQNITQNFDSVRVGEVPFGWMASQTNKKSPAIWEVDKQKRLVIIAPRGYREQERNLFFTKNYYFIDGAVAIDVMPSPDGGVIFRAHDRKDYYDVRIDKNRLIVEAVQKGNIKKLASFPIPKKSRYRLKVEYKNKTAKIYLDGELVGEVEVSPMQGGVGVCASGSSRAKFDNITIEVQR